MQYAIEWDVVSILVFVCVLWIDFERVPERVRPFVGFTSYVMCVVIMCVVAWVDSPELGEPVARRLPGVLCTSPFSLARTRSGGRVPERGTWLF